MTDTTVQTAGAKTARLGSHLNVFEITGLKGEKNDFN